MDSVEDNALIVASNFENDGDFKGLIAGHAYSVEDFETVRYQGNVVKIVRLRNPWGEGEWLGNWSDDWIEANKKHFSQEDLVKLDFIEKPLNDSSSSDEEDEDGKFWMSWDDFIQEFECLSVCHLDHDDDQERRVTGTFRFFIKALVYKSNI